MRGSAKACATWPWRRGLAALSLCLAALQSSAEPQRNPTPIVIGVSNVQSGPSRFLGHKLLGGSSAYFDRLNAAGGVHGRRVEMLVKDDRYEPDPAVQNTDAFIRRDKVFFLFGYVGTATLVRTLPLLVYYEKERIVNVAPFTGADPQRRPPYDRFVFNIRASYRAETRALVRYLHARGHRRIGLLEQADAYGKSGETGVAAALEEFGLRAAGIATYRRNQSLETSMEEQVRILREAGADAVIAIGVYGPCAAFIRDARRGGWEVPIANVSFVGPDILLETLREVSKAAGRDLAAGLLNSQVVPAPEAGLPLVADYRATVPAEKRGFISLEGWLNAAVVAEALRRAGPAAAREDFIRAMESLQGWDPGIGVPLAFSPTVHQGLDRVWLTRVENGRWVPADVPE